MSARAGPWLLTRPRLELIRPAVAPREGWAEAFERMAKAGDDRLLDEGRWGETTWERRDCRW